ncbi:DNA polymerase III subunit epsilon [Breoghania sp. L-A4]|uniref:DNA polymerase III subunit epsilon n=1 Tax=Breoghania sp. L-A4 TaxID=2304600 RepID=UPI000E35C73E|nr:DNA polymerase III subunit epsilon [Breoghania sp. L-A4]AXS38818.1 DNA polymerase III subunit epsilon [Breoghania sp. L-A4]
MREIVLDTETTGLNPRGGDRLVEIGGVELVNQIPSGQFYHVYINPERDMPEGAFNVHGLSEEFLSDKPVFADVAREFIDFIGDATLVIHNAAFDMGFINVELARLNLGPIPDAQVLDTLMLARRKHPAGPNSLDALCSRYGIDNSRRTKHGALLDAELLAEVYIELTGGKQSMLGLTTQSDESRSGGSSVSGRNRAVGPRPVPLPPRLTGEEIAAHDAFLQSLGGELIWNKYRD